MDLLLISEKLDSFQKKVSENDSNRLARKGFNYKEEYNSYYSTIQKFLQKYSIFDSIKVVQLHPSAENNYPHTRPENVICIPNTASFPALEKTLFHEAVHIHQRRNKELWKSFLAKEKWTPYDSVPGRWLEKCRMNPDTIMEQFWCYDNRYVPLPMFVNTYNPVFDQIKVMWYDISTGILEHNPSESFIKKYGNNRQSEHPYEIYAVIMESLGPVSENDINNFIRV